MLRSCEASDDCLVYAGAQTPLGVALYGEDLEYAQ